ncbi:UNVERIFIED_CONTAM: hypothetical protein RMT77_003356 [Armadillidium vulgare]
MAVQGDGGSKEEIKTQFSTIEGLYKLLPILEYSRPNRVVYNNTGSCASSPPVKISYICLSDTTNRSITNSYSGAVSSSGANITNYERTNICYNFGRDLYVYSYKSIKRVNSESDLPKPIEKRSYNKEDVPTCHDFNSATATVDRVSLLVGLLGGQVQLFDPINKELNKSYNSGERLIDKSKVTCIKWIPESLNQFLVSHSSGQMYMYNEELVCGLDRPVYQLFKQGEGYSVYTCKTRSTRNPLYRWSIGDGCINEFTFSPCSKYLAVVSQDGFLRVFNFDTMDLVGSARSYYGGLICVCWSPDGKYVVTGGEDDLVTVWSFHEKRVVARGQGHKSWVTVVAFDPYTTVYADDLDCTEDRLKQNVINGKASVNSSSTASNSTRNSVSSDGLVMPVTSYRLGSVGQDTLLCLWDLKDDVLRQPYFRPRSSTVVSSSKSSGNVSVNTYSSQQTSSVQNSSAKPNNHLRENLINNDHSHSYSSNSFTAKLANLNFGEKKDKPEKDHKRSLSLVSKNTSANSKNATTKGNYVSGTGFGPNSSKLVGTHVCPRLDECPMLEPMVCKKIGHERLCGLIFREDSIITSCQDGCILTWCRPGSHSGVNQHSSSSPTGIIGGGGGGGGGTNNSGGTVV